MTTETCFMAGEVKLTYQAKHKISELPKIISSKDIFEFLKKIYEQGNEAMYRETFYVLCLNCRNRIIAWYRLSTGGLVGTVADSRMIFQAALLANATSVILSHNHPSCEVQPSQQDVDLTKKIKEGGKILEIKVIDHIIISGELDKYYSFADEGQI